MIAFVSPRRAAAGFLFILVFVLSATLAGERPLYAQDVTGEWSRPIPISGALGGSRYPSVVATEEGQVLVFWTVTVEEEGNTIFVSRYDGVAWQRPVDVLIGGPRINAELDGRDRVWLLYQRDPDVILTQANESEATSSRTWGSDTTLNRSGELSFGDFTVDEAGVADTAWMQQIPNCETCYSVGFERAGSDISTELTYRVVADSISSPAARIQILRGPENVLYAKWDVSAQEDGLAGIMVSVSTSGGDTWLRQPHLFNTTDEDIRQPRLALDSANNLLLVYNYGERDEVYYSVSSDQGATWSAPAPIPGLFSGKLSDVSDYFAMATDSAGITHLIAPGRASNTQRSQGLYHVEWDGTGWNNLQEIYNGPAIAEFPSITIANGNHLHVSFATRDQNPVSGSILSTYQVWYTNELTTAPAATRIPLPTFTPSATPTPTPDVTMTPIARPTATPFPTTAPSVANTPPPADSPISPFVIALAPVAVILVGVIVWATVLRNRRR